MFWGFVNFFLNHILTKSLLINNFFHFLNSVDLNELLLTVLAIHLILSFLFKYTCCLLVFTNKFISDGFFLKIPNLVIFPQMVLWYPGEMITVYGRGTLHSCGPTRLNKSKEYFWYNFYFKYNIAKRIYNIRCL